MCLYLPRCPSHPSYNCSLSTSPARVREHLLLVRFKFILAHRLSSTIRPATASMSDKKYTPKAHNRYLQHRAVRLRLQKHKLLLTINGLKSFWATASSEAQTLVQKVAIERFLPYFLLAVRFRNVLQA